MTNYDKYHIHEIRDRIHLICSMIDDFLISQPSMNEEMNKKCEQAQELLCNVVNEQLNLDVYNEYETSGILTGENAKKFLDTIKRNKDKKVSKQIYERTIRNYKKFRLIDEQN